MWAEIGLNSVVSMQYCVHGKELWVFLATYCAAFKLRAIWRIPWKKEPSHSPDKSIDIPSQRSWHHAFPFTNPILEVIMDNG